jgi:hypothetical protein
MGSVTAYTTDGVDALLADAIVSASINSSNGHISMTSKDGTVTDIGSILTGILPASTTAQGIVELATDAETVTGTDATRAATPFGVAAAIAAVPGSKVQIVTTQLETALPTAYPTGISLMSLTGTGTAWSLNSGIGVVVTINPSTNTAEQRFYMPAGTGKFSREWSRTYVSTDGGWTAWMEHMKVVTLTASSFTQTSALTTYPQGWSRLYYTSSGTGWDFSGKAGEVLTFRDGTDFARQEYTQHAGGSAPNATDRWVRTSNSANGWTPWYNLGSEKVVATYTRNAAALASVGATELPFVRMDNIPVLAGHRYEVTMARCIVTVTSTTTLGAARIRGSQSGAATVASTQLLGAEVRPGVAVDTSNVPEQVLMGYWDASVSGLLSLVFTVQRVSGSGTVGLYSAVSTVLIPFMVKDLGVMPANSGTDFT